eukprot:431445_1
MSASKEQFEVTKLNKLRRLPKRGVFDKKTIYGILDEAIWCFVGFNIDMENMNADKKQLNEDIETKTMKDSNENGTSNKYTNKCKLQPCVIPTLFGRKDDYIYIHGSSISRMLRSLTYCDKVPLCITVASFQAFVLAKSAFHHSANYKSVVIYGNGSLIQNKQDKIDALTIISEHILPNRWEYTRLPSNAELLQTTVLRIKMEYVSGKIRNGPPGDDKNDLNLRIWSGLMPIHKSIGTLQPDESTQNMNLSIPNHIIEWEKNKWNKKLKRDPKNIHVNTDIIFMFCAWLSLFIAIWKVNI